MSTMNQPRENEITTIKALEQCVGKTPGPRDLKVIDFLDERALNWLSHSPCLFVSLAGKAGDSVQVLIAAGEAGFIKGNAHNLVIPLKSIDHPEGINQGDGWGSLFVVPSLKESLRVNGTVSSVSDSEVTIEVSECYLHCAKAFMRSELWKDFDETVTVNSEQEFCALTRFMLVATSDDQLRADLSPKGAPPGKLLHIGDDFAWYSDRPGNRRVDGFRNILTQPKIEILALMAGSSQLLRLRGKAVLFSEHPQKSYFSVNKKDPHLVVKIETESIELGMSSALERAKLWPPAPVDMKYKASEIWQAHMKLSKVKGLEATLAKTAISVPGVLEKGLDWDYKNNLY